MKNKVAQTLHTGVYRIQPSTICTFSIPLWLMIMPVANRLNLKFTVSLSLTVNPVNCVCPLLWCLVTVTCLVRINPTFITISTHTFCSGCVNSSQTPPFSQGAEAALLLGSPGRERHTNAFQHHLWLNSNNQWVDCFRNVLEIEILIIYQSNLWAPHSVSKEEWTCMYSLKSTINSQYYTIKTTWVDLQHVER